MSSEDSAQIQGTVELYASFVKPSLDAVLAFTAIVVLSPLLLVVAVAILLEDGRPVLFVHQRTGRHGRPFKIFKFRSMSKDARILPSSDAAALRVTNVGVIIRRLNIDELPQLINILLFQMSFVGPRPGLPSQADLHEARRANGALALRPGITGLAQVNSYDGMTTKTKADFDGAYASRLTLWTDLQVALLTVRYILKPPPVY